MVGHFRVFLKDLMQKQYPNISKSDKLLLVAGEDVIIKCKVQCVLK